jgi:hypothetical protein
MQLLIDGDIRQLIPIRAYRATHHLPDNFGVAYFEPKDFDGLASIDNLPPHTLEEIHAATLRAIPADIDGIVQAFRQALLDANSAIHLKDVELDYAVNGFSDMLIAWVFKAAVGQTDSESAYSEWLNNSVRIASRVFDYLHEGQVFSIQILNTVFGRIGLRIETHQGAVDYVLDRALACPAEGFMMTLFRDVVAKLSNTHHG